MNAGQSPQDYARSTRKKSPISTKQKQQCPRCGHKAFRARRSKAEKILNLLRPSVRPFTCSSCARRFWARTKPRKVSRRNLNQGPR